MKTTRRLFALLMVVCLLAGYAVMPVYAAAATYTFSNYDAGEQYAMDEVHVLDENITVTISDGHFTKQLRLYDSDGENGHNAIAIIKSAKAIESIVLNAGNKDATLEVYGSADGETWALISSLTTTSAYADHTVAVPNGYTYLKLDAVGAQVRVASMTLTYVGDSGDSGDSGEPETPAIPTDPAEIIAAAAALESGAELPYESTLTGVITNVNEAYSSKYNNITVTIQVAGSESTPIKCYRMVGDGIDGLEVGDTITVTGTLTKYIKSVQFKQKAQLVSVVEGPDAPATEAEIVAAAYELADGKYLPYAATLTGTVTEITGAYSEQYKNITLVMTVEGCEDQPITCYRMTGDEAANVAEGDIVTVSGSITNYNGTVEFDSGCTLDALVKASAAPVPGETVDIYNYLWTWNDEGTEATYVATVPANTYNTYNLYNTDGMLLTIDGGEATKLVAPGYWMPCEVVVTNNGDAEAEYVLKISYPVGSSSNPETLTDSATATLEAGTDGYYYTYTAAEDGAVKVTVSGDSWFYCVNNITSGKYGNEHNSAEDPAVPSETVMVSAGDEVQIHVNTYDAEMLWSAPAGEVSVSVEFVSTVECVEGETVLLMDWTWNEEGTEATATVTVPAGTVNTYQVYRVGGMLLSINGGEAELLVAQSPMYPVDIQIANNMPFDQKYELKISYPLGHRQNPDEIWWLSDQLITLEEGDDDGYYYTYTASEDCTLEVTIHGVVSESENAVADITVYNQMTWVSKNVSEDGKDGVLTLEVSAGDVLEINVAILPDSEWKIAAATVNWEINYPAGTEANPLAPNFVWNEDETVGVATVTIEAGETLYIELTQTDAELTVDGGEPITITGHRYFPQIEMITNNGTEAAEYELVVSYPVGLYQNPAELVEGENKVTLEERHPGYHYDFVAPSDGIVTVTVSGETWQYNVMNQTTSVGTDYHYHDDDPVVATETIEVKKGDVIMVMVNTYNPETSWIAPGGEVTVTFGFESTVLLGDCNGDGEVTISDLMRLANYFAKGVEMNMANADCNGDGEVTISDLMRLANYFAGKAQLG